MADQTATSGRGGDTMLTRSGLGDDAFFPHPQCEQRLTDRVIDLMSTGVIEVFRLR